MFDTRLYGLRAIAMTYRRTPSNCLILASVIFAAFMMSGSARAQTAGAIRPSATATQEVLKPETRVPIPVYRSAFARLPQGVETGAVDWRQANAQAGQFPRGHADLLKWEQKNPAGLTVRPQGAQP